jgi:hypothetical protein
MSSPNGRGFKTVADDDEKGNDYFTCCNVFPDCWSMTIRGCSMACNGGCALLLLFLGIYLIVYSFQKTGKFIDDVL